MIAGDELRLIRTADDATSPNRIVDGGIEIVRQLLAGEHPLDHASSLATMPQTDPPPSTQLSCGTGSTTGVFRNPSETLRQQRPKNATAPCWTCQP